MHVGFQRGQRGLATQNTPCRAIFNMRVRQARAQARSLLGLQRSLHAHAHPTPVPRYSPPHRLQALAKNAKKEKKLQEAAAAQEEVKVRSPQMAGSAQCPLPAARLPFRGVER